MLTKASNESEAVNNPRLQAALVRYANFFSDKAEGIVRNLDDIQ